jgi:RimJ/RimL family protein N-acetyltransferase
VYGGHGHSLPVAFFFPEAVMGEPYGRFPLLPPFHPPHFFPKSAVRRTRERRSMSIDNPLFEGNLIRLGPIDHEKDPEIVARWTHNAGFMRMMYTDPARPLSVWQVKKKLEELEKSIEEDKNLFHFRIRTRSDDRLVGIGELQWISWTNASGFIRLGIGAPEDQRQGYGRETLGLLLRYAFDELNLYRLTAIIPEYNLPALALFNSYGFVEEVRRRRALERDSHRWDLLQYGLLADEWKEKRK